MFNVESVQIKLVDKTSVQSKLVDKTGVQSKLVDKTGRKVTKLKKGYTVYHTRFYSGRGGVMNRI